jgi:hypothetical protein
MHPPAIPNIANNISGSIVQNLLSHSNEWKRLKLLKLRQ